jgi:aryl-alcohol dehydrogenase-like predicted oxidoreductase
MLEKKINRKSFLNSALKGFVGFKLFSGQVTLRQETKFGHRTIGNTGIKVSPVCFGAPRTNEESLLKYALSSGINFIDTGRSYGNGNNERLVGRAVSGIRKDIVIQTKIRLDPEAVPSGGKGRRGADEIREILNRNIDESLKALNTDYVDILLYHDASQENLLYHDETLKFFQDLRNSGVIRASGFSAHNDYLNLHERNVKEHLYNIMMVPFNHKGSFVHSVTSKYSEWDQARLIRILGEAGEKGIGIIAMKTCSGGKYSPSPDVEPTFKEAVKWVISNPFISSAAIAMANFEQVDEYSVMLERNS